MRVKILICDNLILQIIKMFSWLIKYIIFIFNYLKVLAFRYFQKKINFKFFKSRKKNLLLKITRQKWNVII